MKISLIIALTLPGWRGSSDRRSSALGGPGGVDRLGAEDGTHGDGVLGDVGLGNNRIKSL